jgi:hypothetical protein
VKVQRIPRNNRSRLRDEDGFLFWDEPGVQAPGRHEKFPIVVVGGDIQRGWFDFGTRPPQDGLRYARRTRVQRDALQCHQNPEPEGLCRG